MLATLEPLLMIVVQMRRLLEVLDMHKGWVRHSSVACHWDRNVKCLGIGAAFVLTARNREQNSLDQISLGDGPFPAPCKNWMCLLLYWPTS